MGRTKDLEQCECDKAGCTAKAIMTADSPQQSEWHACENITIDNTKKPFLLCKQHYEEYKTMKENFDSYLNQWLSGGAK